MTTRTKLLNSESLTDRLKGRQVLRALIDDDGQIDIQFTCGTVLIVEAISDGLVARVENARASVPEGGLPRPTKRQLEYLAFISKYIHRFGRAPAESDIQRHFLVSAPSVNQMMQMLERRGFITRQPGVPRSIRLNMAYCGEIGVCP